MGRRICLGFQWDPASWENIPTLWDALSAWLDSRKVLWNIPAIPSDIAVRKKAAILKPIRSRIEASGDAVTAMGFSGASHPLLNYRRARTGGFLGPEKPVGHGRHRRARDPAADHGASRRRRSAAGAWKLYADHGFGLIGISPDPVARRPEAAAGCRLFTCIAVSSWTPGSTAAQRLRRQLSSSPEVFLSARSLGREGPGGGSACPGRPCRGVWRPVARVFAYSTNRPKRCRQDRRLVARAWTGRRSPLPVCARPWQERPGFRGKSGKRTKSTTRSSGAWDRSGTGPRRAPRGRTTPADSSAWSRTCWATSRWPEADSM